MSPEGWIITLMIVVLVPYIMWINRCMGRKREWWWARVEKAEASGNHDEYAKALYDYVFRCLFPGSDWGMTQYKMRNGQIVRVGKRGVVERP